MTCFNNRDILEQLGTTQSPSTIVLCYYFNPFFLHFFFFLDKGTYFIQIALFPLMSLFLMFQGPVQKTTMPFTHFVFLPSSSLW